MFLCDTPPSVKDLSRYGKSSLLVEAHYCRPCIFSAVSMCRGFDTLDALLRVLGSFGAHLSQVTFLRV